ncbi:MAG: hypothetical protein JWM93_696 [Frankiales bacterium]|nr:hypothetical protein [Frankiales bacterium]
MEVSALPPKAFADLGGSVGLVVTIVLGVACYFLFRSFLTHLKRVPTSFDEPDAVNRPDQEL